MALRKSKHSKRAYAQNPLEIIIREKSKEFLSAEKDYWKQRDALRKSMKESVDALSLKAGEALPADISSTVWGLRDGVAFVRHKSIPGKPTVQFQILPITLEQWGDTGLLVPLGEGEISLARAGVMKGLGHVTLINCVINEIQIPYAEFSHMRYGDPLNLPAVERAILDFQLTLLGLQTTTAPVEAGAPERLSGEKTIERLQEIARQFRELLQGDLKEEALQKFLKEHPFILHQSAERIPKQRLGEDFVTDFVLVSSTTQGPTYALVELERSSHPVLTKDFALASPVSHAIAQIRDWDVWLERNKAYLQNKLPGFETPRYIVVIGRSAEFTEDQKAYMRSYNRDFRNTELLTYDDVLARFEATIQRLHATVGR
jgi:hypothetical protein